MNKLLECSFVNKRFLFESLEDIMYSDGSPANGLVMVHNLWSFIFCYLNTGLMTQNFCGTNRSATKSVTLDDLSMIIYLGVSIKIL